MVVCVHQEIDTSNTRREPRSEVTSEKAIRLNICATHAFMLLVLFSRQRYSCHCFLAAVFTWCGFIIAAYVEQEMKKNVWWGGGVVAGGRKGVEARR